MSKPNKAQRAANRGTMVWLSAYMELKNGKLVKVVAQGTYRRGDRPRNHVLAKFLRKERKRAARLAREAAQHATP